MVNCVAKMVVGRPVFEGPKFCMDFGFIFETRFSALEVIRFRRMGHYCVRDLTVRAGSLDHLEDSMLDDITVGLIALGFIALAFVGACLCDVFRVRREQQQAEYLPKVKVKRVDVRGGKIPSVIAE